METKIFAMTRLSVRARVATMPELSPVHGSRAVISRFITGRTIRGAIILAFIFGAYTASKSVGYAAAYPTLRAREMLSSSFASNIGLKALLGSPHQLQTVVGFAAWNTFMILVVVSAIWSYMTATRVFRGEEDAGRWEIILAGRTSSRRAAINVFAGLGYSLLVFFAIMATLFALIGAIKNVGFSPGAAIYFSLAVSANAALFAALGGLASQIMPTRAQALRATTAIFGLSYILRAAADVSGTHWLLDVSPIGWIEQLHPLSQLNGWWLLPIIGLTFVMVWAAVFLAGRRDLGSSIVTDHDTSVPHTTFLNGAVSADIRLSRASIISWVAGIILGGTFFASFTKTADQAVGDSATAQHIFSHFTQGSSSVGTKTYLGIVFFIIMIVVMCYAASAASSMREDESHSYLDNLLVQPVSRLRWLVGRALLAILIVCLASLLAGIAVWFTLAGQGSGISLHTALMATINSAVPGILILGIGVLGLGIAPRLTSATAYCAIGWSFLVQMVSSGIKLNHWILDTSIFNHVALAPATQPRWTTDLVLVMIALALFSLGVVAFNKRDLIPE
jgi:ABC-2 type transport system permease protein